VPTTQEPGADPIRWLLEPEDPSIRYWTLVDLLGRPSADAEVREARAAIAGQPLAMELFELQHPDGHWGDETKPHTAQGAGTVLGLLHMLGVVPDERTSAGCESFLEFSQHESGGFSMIRTTRSGIFPCTTGPLLAHLVYFGLGDDPRVRAAFGFLVDEMSAEDALDCGRYEHRDCLWGAIAALDGLAVVPGDMRTPRFDRVVMQLADRLLDARLDFQGEHRRWLTFGVPRAWDLLAALRALAAHGYAHDPRFVPLLAAILERRDEKGRWLCGSVSRTWPIERRNRPSKWVTLEALRVLEQASSTGLGGSAIADPT
jgi:hypothetical protein